MREYTTPQAAELLGVAQSTIRKHARLLGIKRIGRDYIFTPTHCGCHSPRASAGGRLRN